MATATILSRRFRYAFLFLFLACNVAYAVEAGAQPIPAAPGAEPKGAAKKADKADAPVQPVAGTDDKKDAKDDKKDAKKNEAGTGGSGDTPRELSRRGYLLVVLYVVLILAFPFAMMWYDLRKAYAFARETRMYVLQKAAADGLTFEELKLLLTELSQSPPGIPGLARNSIAFMLMMILSVAIVHILAVDPPGPNGKIPETIDRILILLTGLLTSVVSFYFGSRAAETAQASANINAAPSPAGVKTTQSITFKPQSGKPGEEVTISGKGFGTSGEVAFAGQRAATTEWSDDKIVAKVPDGAKSGKVSVTPKGGQPMTSSSDFEVKP